MCSRIRLALFPSSPDLILEHSFRYNLLHHQTWRGTKFSPLFSRHRLCSPRPPTPPLAEERFTLMSSGYLLLNLEETIWWYTCYAGCSWDILGNSLLRGKNYCNQIYRVSQKFEVMSLSSLFFFNRKIQLFYYGGSAHFISPTFDLIIEFFYFSTIWKQFMNNIFQIQITQINWYTQ